MTATEFPESRGGREFNAADPRRGGRIVPALLAIASAIVFASRKVQSVATALEDLTTQVHQATTVAQSAVTLMAGLANRISDNKDDPAALEALANELKQSTDELSAAITANTPAAPPPPPAPTVNDAGAPAAIGGEQAATTGPTTAASATDPLTADPTTAS